MLAEQHDEWAEGRRYLGLEVLSRSRMTLIPTTTHSTALATEEVTAITA